MIVFIHPPQERTRLEAFALGRTAKAFMALLVILIPAFAAYLRNIIVPYDTNGEISQAFSVVGLLIMYVFTVTVITALVYLILRLTKQRAAYMTTILFILALSIMMTVYIVI